MWTRGLFRTIGMILAVATAAACASAADADTVADLDLPPVDSEATLTLVGGSETVLSFSELESLPMYEISIVEPFIEEPTVFQGPKLAAVFDVLGLTSGDVEILAINDYGYTLSVAEWGEDALLATRENGRLIDIDAGGPLRVVADDGTAIGEDLAAWVWSVDRLVIG